MASNNHSSGIPTRNGFAHPAMANPAPTRFDPARLLNPRSYTAPLKNNGTSGRSTPTHLPASSSTASLATALDFQFSSPNDGNMSAASTPPSVYSHGSSTPVNGFSNMIDRANNVEERISVPQPKRRRLESDDYSANINGFGGGGNGMVGQYLKDRRDEGSKNPTSAARRVDTVDLTSMGEDDSDVVEIGNSKDQEVCYGMIQGAKLNCHIVPSPKPGQIALTPDWFPQVKIILNRKIGEPNHVILAKDCTRQIVGKVDHQTAQGLSPLLDSRLQLRTDCRIPSRVKEPDEIAGKETSKAYTLDLMLYGPRRSGKPVAKYLSQRQLWLRNPPRVDSGIKYENPQTIEGHRPPPAISQRSPAAVAPAVAQVSRTVEEIRSEVMGVFDSLTESEDLPQMEPDSRILTPLLKHQKQGLHFMTTRERPRQLNADGKTDNSFWQIRLNGNLQRTYYNVITGHNQREAPPETYGGILADMMGLGKTLSILSLVTTSLDAAVDWSKLEPVQPQPPQPKKNGQSSRGFNVPAPAPLQLTRVTRNVRATLLICPLSTVANWEEQIKSHIKPGTFSYYIYHGSNRIKDARKLADFDLVITTYGSVASEVTARTRGRNGPHPLEEIAWFRVVLDEAHMIREQSTLQFKAICRLQANRRWAVTGTPVQNKLDDLAALLAFIRLKPFDDRSKFMQYIVAPFKICDPEIVPKLRVLVDSVTLRRLKDKIDLPPRTDHIVRLKLSPNEEKLYKVFEQNAYDKVKVLSAGRERMVGGKTYIHILQSILRLRLISAHGRELLSDADLELVQGMTEDSAIDLDSDDEEEKPPVAEARAYGVFELMQETNADKCFICDRKVGSNDANEVASEIEENILGYLTACYHLICPSCKPTWEQEAGNHGFGTCPYCSTYGRLSLFELRKDRAAVEHDTKHHSDKKAKTVNSEGYGGPHTKTRALVDDLLKSKADSEANPNEPPFKSVVFSAWTSHLDLIQLALDSNGITYTRLDGKMSLSQRTNAMDKFRANPAVQVILVSIMAGGLGLNLTAANSVYVMEPQYNPAAEAQAVDRIHRLGQKRPVRTVRYIMQNSIEEKMLVLQDKKMKLASLSMDRNRVMDKTEAAKQKLMDLRSLFK